MVHLTVKEKILLHLLEYTPRTERAEMPRELVREGIAEAVSVHLRHVAVYVRPLVAEGLARERYAHVMAGAQRRRVCELTDAGWLAAIALRDRVKTEVVPIRDEHGDREATVARVLEEVGGKVHVLDVVRHAQAGPIDMAALRASPRVAYVDRLSDAPRPRRFVGRHAELEAISAEGEGPRIWVVRGVAGIGKTWLAAKVCETLRGKRNLFWHRVRPWDTSLSLFLSLGDFLKACGKPKLRAVIGKGSVDRAPEILREDLPGSHSLLVYDDVHEATSEGLAFIRCLKDAAATAEDVQAVLLTRQAVPFYDRRDVVLDGLVREIDLSGLGAQEIAELFANLPEASSAVELGRKLGGHPLFLELLRAHAHSPPAPGALRDVERFVEEEIYSRLSGPERRMMKLASLYQVPVPREALFGDASMNQDVLRFLTERSFVRPTGDRAFAVHDTLATAFQGMISAAERDELGGFAYRQLRDLAADAQKAGDLPACLGALSNALEIDRPAEERGEVLERLGAAYDLVGDYKSALVAYGEALALAKENRGRGRLLSCLGQVHMKMGNYGEALRLCEEALSLPGLEGSEEGARALHVMGRVRVRKADYSRALEDFARSRSIRERLGSEPAIAESLNEIGVVHDRQGDYDQSLDHYRRSLAIRERIGDAEGIAGSLNNIGNVHFHQGDYERALEYYGRSHPMSERIGDADGIAVTLNNIGNVHSVQGDYERALEYYRQTLVIRERFGDDPRIAGTLNNIGMVHFHQGDYGRAIEYWGRSLAISERMADQDGIAVTLDNIGMALVEKADYGRALENSQGSLSIRERIGDERGIAQALNNIGKAHCCTGEYDRALEAHRRSLSTCERIGDEPDVAESLDGIGRVHAAQGNYDRAEDYAGRASAIAVKLGDFELIVRSQLHLAEAWLSSGQTEKARDLCNRLLVLASQPGMRRYLGTLHRIVGTLNRDSGMLPEAVHSFEESLRVCGELGTPFEEARSHYEFGVLSRDQGDLERAREHLGAAAQVFERIGAERELARSRETLRKLEV